MAGRNDSEKQTEPEARCSDASGLFAFGAVMLDATPARLKTIGTITIDLDGSIECSGFSADGASCREVAVLAQLWALAAITASLEGDVQQPGGGNSCIGD